MEVKQGYLLISDITGYTEFLVESELLHAKEILDTLLITGIKAIKAPIRMLNTRGDAILAFVDADEFLQPQSLFESIESIYYDYRRQLQFMIANTTCTCRACANINMLDLKLFVHYGEYIEQALGDAVELQGADVILANRLMKNTVKEATGLSGYALISDAAVQAMDAAELVAGMSVHHEHYEHFGEIGMRIWDLPAAWEAEKARNRAEISLENAWVIESIQTTASRWKAWDLATDEAQKRIYYDMISVIRTDEVGGRNGVGSEYHCVHELGDVRFTIVEWDPPHLFMSEEVAFDIPVHFTMQFLDEQDGTCIRIMYQAPRVDGDPDELKPLFNEASKDALARLKDLLEA
jgi:hypothetical protein